MNIKKKKEYNSNEYGSKWNDIVGYSYFDRLEDIKKDLEAIEKLIDTDFNDLSDKDFYDLISNFYSIRITKNDIFNILSKVNGIEYNKFQKLNSRMIFKDIKSEGHGRDFSWWEETYQKAWIVAVSKDLILNSDYNYSKEEIEQMIQKKQIISFYEYFKDIGFDPKLPYESEKVDKINILKIELSFDDVDDLISDDLIGMDYGYFEFGLLGQDDSVFSREVNKNAVSMIRKRLNKKKVLNDCKQIILFLNDNIHVIGELIQKEYFFYESSRHKYLALLEELKVSHKKLLLQYTHKM